MRNKFQKGDFATVEGQIVEIIDLKMGFSFEYDWYQYKIRLLSTKLTNWVDEIHLKPIDNQKTPQVLFRKAQ